MPINENEVTKEQIYKAMQCNTADELRAYAKSEGYDITKEEAEAYLDELSDVELDQAELHQVAGGACWDVNGCSTIGHGPCPGNDCPSAFNGLMRFITSPLKLTELNRAAERARPSLSHYHKRR